MNDNFIIHKNETPFGYVWHIVYKPGIGLVSAEYDKLEDTFYVYGLVVLEEERKKGVGSALLEQAEEIARENNFTIIRLDVDMNHDVLLPYYKKRGYILEHKNKQTNYCYLSKSLNDF